MSSKNKIPKLRFRGFSLVWHVNKLKDIADINNSTQQIPDTFNYIELGSVNHGKINNAIKISKTDAPSRAQRTLNIEDILFQTVRPYLKNNYYHQTEGSFVASTGYAQIKAKQVPKFLYYYLFTDSFMSAVSARSTGTSYPAINSSELKEINVRYPEILEQKKIATFFTKVDDWIETLRKQKKVLEKYEKGVLQQVFSQKILFKNAKGDNYSDWKNWRLGELLSERNEKNGKKAHQLLSVKIRGGVVPQEDTNKTDSSTSDKRKYKIVKVGDIAYNTMRMWQGASGVSQYEGIVSPAYTVVYPKNGDANFYGYLFKHPRTIFNFYRYSQGLTSDTWNLKFQHFSEIEVTVPINIEEQKKIAAFLSSLDKLIEHKEKQIALAEQWKKGLLQQMFV